MEYNRAMTILRKLSVGGNPVATTYLHLLYHAAPGDTPKILQQIEGFVQSFISEAGRVGPSEYKTPEEVTSWSIKP